jgi:hypothetical protein
MENLKPPGPLSMEGNISENWKKWKQEFQFYLTATEMDKKCLKLKCSLLLTIIGDDALDVYNTFDFTDEADRLKLDVLLQKFEDLYP